MLLPSVVVKYGRSGKGSPGALRRRCAIERTVDAIRVVIGREFA